MKKYNWIFLFALLFALVGVQGASAQLAAGSYIKVLSPNGGETVNVGDTIKISWESSSTVEMVDVYLISLHNGAIASTERIGNNILNTGDYSWFVRIGNTSNTQYKIKTTGYKVGVGSVTDMSDSPFTINQSSGSPFGTISNNIILTSPNGGEVWEIGKTYTVTWTQTPNINDVSISLKRTVSEQTDMIVSALKVPVGSTTGSYAYTVPEKVSGNYPVQEASTYTVEISGGSARDSSDGPFTIKKSNSATLPSGASGLPTPRTYWAKEITDTTAVLTGSVDANGTPDIYAWFEWWGPKKADGINSDTGSTPKILVNVPGLRIQEITATLTNLKPGQSYSYQMVASRTNSGLKILGDFSGFATKVSTEQTSPPTQCPQDMPPLCSAGQELEGKPWTRSDGCRLTRWTCVDNTTATTTQMCPQEIPPLCSANQVLQREPARSNGCPGILMCVNKTTTTTQTNTNNTDITSLLKLIEELKKQIAALQGQAVGENLPNETTTFSYNWQNALYVGLKNNEDVRALQNALLLEKVYTGPVTGNFGPLTLAATKAFQEKYGITPVTGFVGELTRAKLNSLY